jgi:hypothetical protein
MAGVYPDEVGGHGLKSFAPPELGAALLAGELAESRRQLAESKKPLVSTPGPSFVYFNS